MTVVMSLSGSDFRRTRVLRTLRYAGIATFVIAFAVAVGHTVPQIRRSIVALNQVQSRQLRALALDSDLFYQLQKGIDQYLEILKDAPANGFPAGPQAQLDKTHSEIDATIQKLNDLGVAPAEVRDLRDSWTRGHKLGMDAMDIAKRTGVAEGRNALLNNGTAPAIARARAAIEAIKINVGQSSRHDIADATKVLQSALIQLVALLAVTLVGSSLFAWLESRNRRMLHRLAEAHRELEKVHRNLSDSEDRFHAAYEGASVGMALLDLNGHLLGTNRAMSEITGFRKDELVGKPAVSLLAPEERNESAVQLKDLVSGMQGSYRAECRAIRKDGKPIWARNSMSLLHAGGQPDQVFLIAEDVTERHEAFDYIRHQANHDSITSLPNRFQFENTLREVVGRARRENESTGLLYLDLDGFKLINDTLGHAAGDQVLKKVGDRLSAALPANFVARLGGDEFAVIAANCQGKAELAGTATALLKAIMAPVRVGGNDLQVGATIGIALCPEDAATPDCLVQHADAAMYEAKRAGRNRFSFFTESIRRRTDQRIAIEANLRQALERGEFHVVYQSLYDVGTGRLARLEALCRWRNASLGDVPPAQFIPVAEETGLIVELGQFVLREACKQARQWADCGSVAGISVNVSAVQFSRPDFLDTVKSALKESGLAPSRLQLELTESVILKNIAAGVLQIERLNKMGVRVSIDDFGTGYSSLSYLQKMPVHAVKIDRSFVADVDTNAGSVSMIRSVMALARAVGLRVVTEGVETESQLDLMRSLGCDEVQGFLLGRPESARDALERVLAECRVQVCDTDRELATV